MQKCTDKNLQINNSKKRVWARHLSRAGFNYREVMMVYRRLTMTATVTF